MKKFIPKNIEDSLTNVYTRYVEPDLKYTFTELHLAAATPAEDEAVQESAPDENLTPEQVQQLEAEVDAEEDAAEAQAQQPGEEEPEEATELEAVAAPAGGEVLSGGDSYNVIYDHNVQTADVFDVPRDLDIGWTTFHIELYVPPIFEEAQVIQPTLCEITIIIRFCCSPISSWGRNSCHNDYNCCGDIFDHPSMMTLMEESEQGYSFWQTCCFGDEGPSDGPGEVANVLSRENLSNNEYDYDRGSHDNCVEIELHFLDSMDGPFGQFAHGDGPCCFDLGVMVVSAALERAAFEVPEHTHYQNHGEGESDGGYEQQALFGRRGGGEQYGHKGIQVSLGVDVCIECQEAFVYDGLSGIKFSNLGVSFAMSVSCDPNYNSRQGGWGRDWGNDSERGEVALAVREESGGCNNDPCCFLSREFNFDDFMYSVLSDCCQGKSNWNQWNNYGNEEYDYNNSHKNTLGLDFHLCCAEGFSVGTESDHIDYVNASTFWVSVCLNCTENKYGYFDFFGGDIGRDIVALESVNNERGEGGSENACCIDCNWITDWLSSLAESQSAGSSEQATLVSGYASEISPMDCVRFEDIGILLQGLLQACCCEKSDHPRTNYSDQMNQANTLGFGRPLGFEFADHQDHQQSIAFSIGAENVEIYDEQHFILNADGCDEIIYDFSEIRSWATVDVVLCVTCESDDYGYFNPYGDGEIGTTLQAPDAENAFGKPGGGEHHEKDCCFDCFWLSDFFLQLSDYGVDDTYCQPPSIGFEVGGLLLGEFLDNCCCTDGGFKGGYIFVPDSFFGLGDYKSNDHNSLELALQLSTGSSYENSNDDGTTRYNEYGGDDTTIKIAVCAQCDTYQYGYYGHDAPKDYFSKEFVEGSDYVLNLYLGRADNIYNSSSGFLPEGEEGATNITYSQHSGTHITQDLTIVLEVQHDLQIHELNDNYDVMPPKVKLDENVSIVAAAEEETGCVPCDFEEININFEFIDGYNILDYFQETFDCIEYSSIELDCEIDLSDFKYDHDYNLETNDALKLGVNYLEKVNLDNITSMSSTTDSGLLDEYFNSFDNSARSLLINLCVECNSAEYYDNTDKFVGAEVALNEENALGYGATFALYQSPQGCCFDCDWVKGYAEYLSQVDISTIESPADLTLGIAVLILGDALECCCQMFSENGYNIKVVNPDGDYQRGQYNSGQLALNLEQADTRVSGDSISTTFYPNDECEPTARHAENNISKLDSHILIDIDLKCEEVEKEYLNTRNVDSEIGIELVVPGYLDLSKGSSTFNSLGLSIDVERSFLETNTNTIQDFENNVLVYDQLHSDLVGQTQVANVDLQICCASEESWYVSDAGTGAAIFELGAEEVINTLTGKDGKDNKDHNDCCMVCELSDNLSNLLTQENLTNTQNFNQLGVLIVGYIAETAINCACENIDDGEGKASLLHNDMLNYEHHDFDQAILELDITLVDNFSLSEVDVETTYGKKGPDTVAITHSESCGSTVDLELAISTATGVDETFYNIPVKDTKDILIDINLPMSDHLQFNRAFDGGDLLDIHFAFANATNNTVSDSYSDSDYTITDTVTINTLNTLNLDLSNYHVHREDESVYLSMDDSSAIAIQQIEQRPAYYEGFEFTAEYCIQCDELNRFLDNVNIPLTSEGALEIIAIPDALYDNAQAVLTDSLCCAFENVDANLVVLAPGVVGTYELYNLNSSLLSFELDAGFNRDLTRKQSVVYGMPAAMAVLPPEGEHFNSSEKNDYQDIALSIVTEQVHFAEGFQNPGDQYAHFAATETSYNGFLHTQDDTAISTNEKITDVATQTTTQDQMSESIQSETIVSVSADEKNTVLHFTAPYYGSEYEGVESCCVFGQVGWEIARDNFYNYFSTYTPLFAIFGGEVEQPLLNEETSCFDCIRNPAKSVIGNIFDEYDYKGYEHYNSTHSKSLELMIGTNYNHTNSQKNIVTSTDDNDVLTASEIESTDNFTSMSLLGLKVECNRFTDVNYDSIQIAEPLPTSLNNNETPQSLIQVDSDNAECCLDCEYVTAIIDRFNHSLSEPLLNTCAIYQLGNELLIGVIAAFCVDCPDETESLIRGYELDTKASYYNGDQKSIHLGYEFGQVEESSQSELHAIFPIDSEPDKDLKLTIENFSGVVGQTLICLEKGSEQAVNVYYGSDFVGDNQPDIVPVEFNYENCCINIEDCNSLLDDANSIALENISDDNADLMLHDILFYCDCDNADLSYDELTHSWSADPVWVSDDFMGYGTFVENFSFYAENDESGGSNMSAISDTINDLVVESEASSAAAVAYSVVLVCEDVIYGDVTEYENAMQAMQNVNLAIASAVDVENCCYDEINLQTIGDVIQSFVSDCCEQHQLDLGHWTNDTYGTLSYENHSTNSLNLGFGVGNFVGDSLSESISDNVNNEEYLTNFDGQGSNTSYALDLSINCYHEEFGAISVSGLDQDSWNGNGTSYFDLSDYGLEGFDVVAQDMSIMDGAITDAIQGLCQCCTDGNALFDPTLASGNLEGESYSQLAFYINGAAEAYANGSATNEDTGYTRGFEVTHNLSFIASLLVCTDCYTHDNWSINPTESNENPGAEFSSGQYPICCPEVDLNIFESIIMNAVDAVDIANYFMPPDIPYVGEIDDPSGYSINGNFYSNTTMEINLNLDLFVQSDGSFVFSIADTDEEFSIALDTLNPEDYESFNRIFEVNQHYQLEFDMVIDKESNYSFWESQPGQAVMAVALNDANSPETFDIPLANQGDVALNALQSGDTLNFIGATDNDASNTIDLNDVLANITVQGNDVVADLQAPNSNGNTVTFGDYAQYMDATPTTQELSTALDNQGVTVEFS